MAKSFTQNSPWHYCVVFLLLLKKLKHLLHNITTHLEVILVHMLEDILFCLCNFDESLYLKETAYQNE